MFKIAHLSDPHLPLPSHPTPRQLFSQRILGYLNWLRSRKHVHQWRPLFAITEDIASYSPDHVAVTGDLVNIALPKEMEAADRWLDTLGTPTTVSFVPGNHEAYVNLPEGEGLEYFKDHLTGPRQIYAHGKKQNGETISWPFMRYIKSFAIICLNTASPSAPFMATGALGKKQIEDAGKLLEQAKAKGKFRIVLIHHPPLPGQTKPARRLLDAGPFGAVLREHGAELVLHGHNHEDMLTWGEGIDSRIPIVGVPSASSTGYHGHEPAQWNLFSISKSSNRWLIEMEARQYDPQTHAVVTRYTKTLTEG